MIRSLCGWVLFVAIVNILIGLLVVLGGLATGAGSVAVLTNDVIPGVLIALRALCFALTGLIACAQGVFGFQTRSALISVVSTDTHDQHHLSQAFAKLKLFFLCQLLAFGVGVITALIGVAMAFLAPELVQGGGFPGAR